MTKHGFRPLIVVDAEDAEAARKAIFRLLTLAVSAGHLYHFTLPQEAEQDD